MASDVSVEGISFREMYDHQNSSEASVSRLPPAAASQPQRTAPQPRHSHEPSVSHHSVSAAGAAPAAPVIHEDKVSNDKAPAHLSVASRGIGSTSSTPHQTAPSSGANLNNRSNTKFVPQTMFNAPETSHIQFSTMPRNMGRQKPIAPHKQMTIQLDGARDTRTASFHDIWPPALYTADSDSDDEEQSIATNVYADIQKQDAAGAEGEPSVSMTYNY